VTGEAGPDEDCFRDPLADVAEECVTVVAEPRAPFRPAAEVVLVCETVAAPRAPFRPAAEVAEECVTVWAGPDLEVGAARTSTVTARQPELVPPTLTLVADQLVTPWFVSCPAASSVLSRTSARRTIPVGGVSSAVSTERCPARPTTHDVPSVTWRVSAG
jgi:hypothetical protein